MNCNVVIRKEIMDEIVNELTKLIGFVKSTSPEIWRIYLRQQIIVGYILSGAFVFSIVGLISGIVVMVKKPWWSLDSFNDCIVGKVMTIVFGFLFIFALVGFVTEGLPKILNPEFYAISELRGR